MIKYIDFPDGFLTHCDRRNKEMNIDILFRFLADNHFRMVWKDYCLGREKSGA